MTSSQLIPEPGALTVDTGGGMRGRTGSYDKRLCDMHWVYRDRSAFEATVAKHGEDYLVYRVAEHRNSTDRVHRSSARAHSNPAATATSTP